MDPTDRLWFSGIPEGHRSKGGGSRRHSSLHLTPHPTLLTSSTPPHSTHVLEGGALEALSKSALAQDVGNAGLPVPTL